MKKTFAILLALIMVLSLATTAFAEEKNDSITITNAAEGETYKLYKLFDLVVDSETAPKNYSYTICDEWKDFFTTGEGKDLITVNDEGYVTEIGDGTAAAAAALAKAAAAALADKTVIQTVTVAEGEDTAVFDNLGNGYYLITSSLGTVAMTETTPANADVTIKEKNPEDTIVKNVQEDEDDSWGSENDAQVGDTVNFKSTATLNPNTRNVKIHDTMDSGLTYNNDVKIYTDAAMTQELDADSYVIQDTPDDGDTFTIKFEQAYLDSLTAPTTLYVAYSAVLNENAVVKDDKGEIVKQNNKTTITYGDKQSVESETTTITYKFELFKHAEGEDTHLAGATFKLMKDDVLVPLVKIDDNNYRVAKDGEESVETFTTNETGNIVIWGVDNDTNDAYTLVETEAPVGYNLLKDPVEITVGEENAFVANVANKSGTELPSTGGVGTTMFYVFGSMMVVGAAVVLVTKKRMTAAE